MSLLGFLLLVTGSCIATWIVQTVLNPSAPEEVEESVEVE